MKRALLLASAALVVVVATGVATADNMAGKSKPATVTGCLSGPNEEGVYVLKTKTTKVEVGGLADLKDHVGHEVKLTGNWASAEAIGEKEEASAKSDAKTHAEHEKKEAREKHLKVTSIQHIAETCKTGEATKKY
jgi:hypothetical protein